MKYLVPIIAAIALLVVLLSLYFFFDPRNGEGQTMPPAPAMSSNFFVLNAPLLTILGPDGNEIVLQDGVECETFFFGGTANEFAAVGLDRIDLNIVGAIKAAGNDANLNISADRRNARLKNGQTVYYGAKIKPPARGKVTGVTFVLTTVPTSGVPDIVNNSFNIKYVESVGGRAGDVKSGSTSGKAYQVINPAGDFLYYFSFTAVVNSGGIQTTIVPHYFGGAMVREVSPKYIQCCCVHTKSPLPRVPEITYSCWYGFAHISKWFVSCFRAALAKAVCANTANVPCEGPEATGVEITITGDGFERIRNELTPDRIKITDEQGSVARVTQITEIANTTIKAKMDITACRPGIKHVKIEGAGGFTTLTLIKVVRDVPDTIAGQKRFQATRILGTQEKLALTTTLSPGSDNKQNVVFAPAKYQIYDVTCVTRNSDTTATTTTTGGCNNIATTVNCGTSISGEDNTTVSSDDWLTCVEEISNADINMTTDLDGNGIDPSPSSVDEKNEGGPGAFICVGDIKDVLIVVNWPSEFHKVTLSSKNIVGADPVIRAWYDKEKTKPIKLGGKMDETYFKKFFGIESAQIWIEGVNPGKAELTVYYDDYTATKSDTIIFNVIRIEAGAYIVPGSTHNVVRYSSAGTSFVANNAVIDVLDKSGKVVRTFSPIPSAYATGKDYAELTWNGKDDMGNALTEKDSIYTYRLSIGYAMLDCVTARIETWLMDVEIADRPGGQETLVTGPDERTLIGDNLEVAISLDANPATGVGFDFQSNTFVEGGSPNNQRGCKVTPRYTFYTTPKTPYDIRYQVVIQQKTTTAPVSPDGLELKTVVDGTLNPWDMDPQQQGRQTKGTWEFGIDSSGEPPGATRRDLVEGYSQ